MRRLATHAFCLAAGLVLGLVVGHRSPSAGGERAAQEEWKLTSVRGSPARVNLRTGEVQAPTDTGWRTVIGRDR